MANKTCEKCGHIFASPSHLQVHLRRKTSCDTNIIKTFVCKHCNISYKSSNSMYRHIRNSCNIAKNKQPVPVQPTEIPIPIQTIIQTDIQILQLQMQQMQMQLTQNNIILQVQQPIQLIQQPIQLIQQPIQ